MRTDNRLFNDLHGYYLFRIPPHLLLTDHHRQAEELWSRDPNDVAAVDQRGAHTANAQMLGGALQSRSSSFQPRTRNAGLAEATDVTPAPDAFGSPLAPASYTKTGQLRRTSNKQAHLAPLKDGANQKANHRPLNCTV